MKVTQEEWTNWPLIPAALWFGLPGRFSEVEINVLACGKSRILTAQSGRTTIAICEWGPAGLELAEEIFLSLYPT